MKGPEKGGLCFLVVVAVVVVVVVVVAVEVFLS